MADERTAVSEAGGAGAWVRRRWCVWVAVGLVVLGAVLNAIYLFNNCPLDLSGDEAHYWEWSRHLDYGYYSKPPGIAWVIGGAVRLGAMLGVNGDGSGAALMPVMRMAAVVFGVATGMLSLLLARRMFRDDRAALGVIGLSAAVPMFAVGSLLITIDSPMYLCWAGTVYCLWRAVEGNARWMLLAGVVAGIGMLFKPVLVALPLCCVVGAVCGGRGGAMRRAFFSWQGAVGVVIMMCSQVPVVVWNSRHDWVMFKHIGTQGFGGGAAKSAVQAIVLDPLSRMGSFVGGQAGGMGGILFVLLVIAVWAAWGKTRRGDTATGGRRDDAGEPWMFLLSFTVPLWGFYFVMNVWKGTELNWPAASYFTGMILLAGIFVEGWNSMDGKHRKVWRTWGTIAVVWGMVATAAAINAQRLYPWAAEKLRPLAGTPAYFNSWWHPRRWEKPIVDKLMGMDARAQVVEQVREAVKAKTGQEPLIIAGRYDDASSLSFYLPGHPFVYCIMSGLGGRQNQYDIWPGLNETVNGKMVNAGRPAVIVGDFSDEALKGVVEFEEIGKPAVLGVPFDGIVLKQVTVREATGFVRLHEKTGGPF